MNQPQRISGDFGSFVSAKLNASELVASGQRLSEARRFADAEARFHQAIALDASHAAAHSSLGWARQMQGDYDAALGCYERALALDRSLSAARRRLATLLVRLGRREESLPLWRAEMRDGPDGLAPLRHQVTIAMRARNLTLAGEFAAIAAELRWGRASLPVGSEALSESGDTPSYPLSIPKLRHDMEQFQLLLRRGKLGDAFVPVVAEYERVIDHMRARGPDTRVPLGSAEHRAIRHVYNRLVYVRPTPRAKRALSDTWDGMAVENQYIDNRPGLVVVDDFLSREALQGVREFCLESTVWSGNRYAHGRLGAFFQDGFNCPLLLQIAEELRATLPRVIGDRHTLRQLWGFKNTQPLPADATTHADFAAVNVNFWITPERANLDENSGGLVVYDVDAPLHWDFDTYNGRSDIIKPFLERQKSRAVTIPYRQNRAIIFNSDLFHGTAAVNFDPTYENHRINVTMLYGDRENEVHHRQLARPDPTDHLRGVPAWRSASFSRFRKARR